MHKATGNPVNPNDPENCICLLRQSYTFNVNFFFFSTISMLNVYGPFEDVQRSKSRVVYLLT